MVTNKCYVVQFLSLLIVIVGLKCVDSAKIVGHPLNAYSHTANLIRVGEELHQRGHSYTLLLSTWVRDKLHKSVPFKTVTYQSHLEDEIVNFCVIDGIHHPYSPSKNCSQLYGDECETTVTNKEVISTIADADILICDVSGPCCHALAKIARVPITIDYSPVGILDPFFSSQHRVPNNLAIVPQFLAAFTNKMSFTNRLTNTLLYVLLRITQLFVIAPTYNNILLEHGITEKVFVDKSPAPMLLVGSDFAIEFSRPITPSVKMIGPVLPKASKPLLKDLEDFVSSGDNGFIFVSFGTVAVALNELADVNELAKGFGQMPYKVLWKYNGPPIVNVNDNIKLVKWAPQNDILGHPKIKAFISHCGMNSLLEAAYHGVPVVGVPLIGDQPGNARKVVASKMGVIIEIGKLNAEMIKKQVENVVSNSTYHENAKSVSAIIQDRPSGRSPVEEAGDWIEYAITFDGGKHLLSEEFNLSFYQTYLLDIIGFIAIILYVLYYLIKSLCKCCCKRKVKKD